MTVQRMSLAQEQLWFLQRLDARQTAYNVPRTYRITGPLDADALARALDAVVARQAVLRTRFHEVYGQPLAQVSAQAAVALRRVDLQALDAQASQIAVADLVQAAENHVFDLETAPALIATLASLAGDVHVLVTCVHHIVSDAGSHAAFASDLSKAYHLACAVPGPVHLPPLAVQFAEVAARQRDDLETGRLTAQCEHWHRHLGTQVPALELPIDCERPQTPSFAGASLLFDLPRPLVDGLRAFCRTQRCTPFVVLMSAWQVTLARFSGQGDFAIGVPHAGRDDDALDGVIGYFINMHPYRVRLSAGQSLLDVCRQVRGDTLDALQHADVPLAALLEQRNEPRDPARSPLFQVAFGVQMATAPVAPVFEGASVETVESIGAVAKFELTLDLRVATDAVQARLEYRTDLFAPATMAGLQSGYTGVLEQLLSAPQTVVGDVSLLPLDMQQRLQAWGAGEAEAHPAEMPVQRQIEACAARTPAAVAVACDQQSLSFAQLDAGANRVAQALVAAGVRPGGLVGVSLRRGLHLFSALLGVLKAAAAYVPLDPDYPAERLARMRANSGVALVLDDAWLAQSLAEGADVAAPVVAQHPDQLAYVIYTSGSTGTPKGVGVSHGALARHIAAIQRRYAMGPADREVQFASINFDIAHERWLAVLGAGGTAVLWDPRERTPAELIAHIRQHRANAIFLPPAYLDELTAELQQSRQRLHLRLCVIGGEAWSQDSVDRARAVIDAEHLINAYGPTETVIAPTAWRVEGQLHTRTAPIGRPIGARQAEVLDADLQPVLPGVAGELYLGGDCLARGCLGQPGLTAERFVAAEGGQRRYRSGDRVRWTGEGQLEHLGRLDQQLKIRGLRIEPGEIEARLLAQHTVSQALVMARPGAGGTRLVAYVAGRVDAARLRRELPHYMVPSAIVERDELPLLPGGAVDRAALLALEVPENDHHESPRGEAESVIAEVWAGVLRIATVGRNANFFELGGDSILSMQMVSRLFRRGWIVTSAQIFEHQTVAALAAAAIRKAEEPRMNAQPQTHQIPGRLSDYLTAVEIADTGLDESGIEDVFPLVPTQEGMLFHSLETVGSGLYVNQTAVTMGGLDAVRFTHAWRALTARHAMLRTGVLWRSGMARPLQVVFREAQADVQIIDWSDQADVEAQLREFERVELTRDIDWVQAPLARVRLLRLPDGRYRLVWTRHHLMSDGWSDSRLLGEWLGLYAGDTLAPQRAVYGDYVRWLQSRDSASDQTFWTAQLSALPGPTLLGGRGTKADGAEAHQGFAQIYTHLDRATTASLHTFAQGERVTVNTLVQAAWALLLQHHTDREQVAFGVTTAGRPPGLPGVEDMVGLFINTLPLALAPRAGQSVAEFLRDIQARNLQVREHEQAALSDIQRWAGSSGRALFDSIIVFENSPLDDALRDLDRYGLAFDRLEGRGVTGYAMDLQVLVGETTEIEYCYSRADFDDGFVHTLRTRMESLLRQFCADGTRPLGELQWVDAQERQALQMLGAGEEADVALPRTSVHAIIQAQAALRPDAIALMMGDEGVGYGELNRRANRLAGWLRAHGVRADVRVAVALERSLDSIVAFLAVLKAGGAYVPMDPAQPLDRLAYVARDSGAVLVLTQAALVETFAPLHVQRVPVDTLDLQGFSADDIDALAPVHPDQLAYVIYTSGSTGLPKGVAVSHGPLAMHCLATARIYGIGPQSCELHFMSFSFDGAHERWLAPLCVGAGLALRSPELWTAEQTYQALHRFGVTTAAFPPAYLGQIAEWASVRKDAPPVELYVFGGEAMPRSTYDKVCRHLKPRSLINGYGPTETVVTPLIWKSTGEPFDCAYAPIGRPVGERVIHILDAYLRVVPQGAVGELYVGGYGLARGYLDRAGMSADRFVADPFRTNGGRLYRTGDLVRWRDDGQVEYMGRTDLQVKVRGFRIELGEIEARLLAFDAVAQAAVLARDGASGKQLVAYLVAHGEQDDGWVSRIRNQLGECLPDYMVPARYMILPALPRLVSGKLDAAALPAPSSVVDAPESHMPAPRCAIEAQVVDIWKSVLGVEKVGIQDNFFELGGDSILSLQLISRIRQAGLGFTWRLRDLMRHQTVEALMNHVGPQEVSAAVRKPPVQDVTETSGAWPLGPIQAWFLNAAIDNRHHFNQSMLLRVEAPLDTNHLRQVIALLVDTHLALRTRFQRNTEVRWEQTLVSDRSDAMLWEGEVTDAADVEARCQEAQESLHIETGPLWRVVHLRHVDGSARLLIVAHHLVIDGVSWRLLIEDLQNAYEAIAVGRQASVPAATLPFGRWTQQLRDWAGSALLGAQLPYWQRQLKNAVDLPCDIPGAIPRVRDMVLTGFALDEETTSQLLREAPAAYGVTMDALLLTALARTLASWTRRDGPHLVTLEGHGRQDDEFDLDLSRTIGWFTSAYPVQLTSSADGEQTVRAVDAILKDIPQRGLGFGVLKYLHPDPSVRGTLGVASPQIGFNYMGQFDQMHAAQSRFGLASEKRGRDQDGATLLAHRIDIVAGVRGGRLLMDWIYGSNQYHANTIANLVATYQQELTSLVVYAPRLPMSRRTSSNIQTAQELQ